MVDLSKLSWEQRSLDGGHIILSAVLIHREEIRIHKEGLGLIPEIKKSMRIMVWRAFYGRLLNPALDLCQHAKYYCPPGKEVEVERLVSALMELISDPVSKAGTTDA